MDFFKALKAKDCFYPLLALAALFVCAAMFRPLMPIDETRYMTVAWEMYVRHSFALLSVNFEPYHHKPPLLFWLINLSWAIFGVGRTSALLVIFAAACGFVLLSHRLAGVLFPAQDALRKALPWVIVGSIPFLIYGSLVMFDVLLTVFVLAAVLTLLRLAEKPDVRLVLLAGLLTGLGVLVKGPVAGLYVFAPALLYPLWRTGRHTTDYKYWYFNLVLIFLLACVPVGLWLAAVAAQSDSGFLYWLLWKQTAGRVTGSFSAAHVRPVYFYLMILPVMALPWAFFPAFWKNAKKVKAAALEKDFGIRFLLCWFVPVFLAFSVISGKQIHYMIPLVPSVMLMISYLLAQTDFKYIQRVAVFVVSTGILAQVIASFVFFPRYDLQPIASYVADHADKDWAYVRNYEGELGFLGRLTIKLTDYPDKIHLPDWFKEHPNGMAVMRYKHGEELHGYNIILLMDYRGKNIAIVSLM